MKVATLNLPAPTPAAIAEAAKELQQRPNERDILLAEIRRAHAQARKGSECRAVDGVFQHAIGLVSKMSAPEQLIALRHAKSFFEDLAAQQKAEFEAAVQRGFDTNLAHQLEARRAQSRLEWRERQAAPVVAAIDKAVERLMALRGRLAPETLADWHQQLEDCLDSCRGSVAAALTVNKGGAIELKKVA